MFVFFVFKQKTAYEMRISDWSSDVCSSDLTSTGRRTNEAFRRPKMGLRLPKRSAVPGSWPRFSEMPNMRTRMLRSGRYLRYRLEERWVGNECGSQCRDRWSRDQYKKIRKKKIVTTI